MGNSLELDITAGITQLGQIGLSKALIVSLQMFWEWNELNLTMTMVLDNSLGNIQEWFSTTGTSVIDSRWTFVLVEPQVNLGNVTNINEITQLTAILIAVNALKQFWILTCQHLGVQMEGY